MALGRGCWLAAVLVALLAAGASPARAEAWTEELEQGGAAVSGGRRSLQASTMSGLYVEVFYNYPYGASSQPNPIPASMKPDYVTSAPNINFAEGTTATNGAIQVLAKATTQFAVRFSAELTAPNTADTTYKFGISSDDGSSMYIRGYNVANDSGTHGMNGPLTGSVTLIPGGHTFSANYFQATGSAGFIASYATGSAALAPIPQSWFTYSPTWFAPAPPPRPPPPKRPPPPRPPPPRKSPPPRPPLPKKPPPPPTKKPPPPPAGSMANINAVKSGSVQMNGVNLGGWLVIEEFLSPDMYKNTTTMKPYRSPRIPGGVNFQDYGPYGERQLGWAADELDRNDTTHTKNYTGRFRTAMFNHRNTFIQESDFALLAANGINCVRIPVGFWLFQKTQAELFPFVEGSYLNLNDAFDWAETHDIGIWLDFHAQNGSQNGYEASAPTRARAGFWDLAPGQTTNIFGPGGPAAHDLSYVQDSINFATQLIQTYCPRSALVAMSMLNEPNSQNVTVLQKYHYALYPIYRKYCPDQWFVVAPQIFYEIPGTFWQHFMANSSYTKVLQDIHDYPKSPKTNTVDGWTAQAFNNVYQTWNNYVKGGGIKAVFGEWTLAGPNYNYSGYAGTWDNTPIQINASNYYDASKHAFLQPGTQGWFQWNYRIWMDQGPDVWSWYRCIYNNWLGKADLYGYPETVSCTGC